MRRRRPSPSATRRSDAENDGAAPDCRATPRTHHARDRWPQRRQQALLSAHGFDASMIPELVNHGLATLTAEKVRAGGKHIAVARVRITEAGRGALAAEG